MSQFVGIVSLILVSFAFNAQAGRTVNLMNMNDKIVLTNPSTVAVTYDVACYTPSGSSIVNLTGETLAPNATKTYGASVDITTVSNADACSASADIGSFSHVSCGTTLQAKLCPGTTDFANASSLCGTGLTLCNYLPGNYMSCGTSNGYWINNPTSGAVEISPDGGCTWSAMATTSAMVLSDRWQCGTPMYSQGCRVAGGNAVPGGCGSAAKTSTSYGAVCCAQPASSFCKVTINSTSADAYLSSPNFKGGAPF